MTANKGDAGAPLPESLSREEILRILEKETPQACAALAKRADAQPEVLYFLAAEGTPEARRAVAANPKTPVHANRLLVEDDDDDVRIELARKIGRLLPKLTAEANYRLRNLTIETLELLAQDQLARVRQVLAEEIKALDCVPKNVIDMLVRDVELVSAPILEYSPLLTDADLVELISSAQARHVLVSIAKRRPLSANISDAIVNVLNTPAVAMLLQNASAEIREQTLEKVVEQGQRVKEWHLPLVERADISQRLLRRIAGFVSTALLEQLAQRNGLDEEIRQVLAKRMRSRLESHAELADDGGASEGDEILALHREGKLDETYIARAAEAGRREAVIAALSLKANVSKDVVARIFQSRSAKPVVSLVWRAGLGMRAAFKIQNFILRLPARELLPARDGVRFPLSEEEMRWHLGYFEVPV
jgi:uncharacterized protein (DUF2336 family)